MTHNKSPDTGNADSPIEAVIYACDPPHRHITQREGEDNPREESCRAYARDKGYRVVETFCDHRSGPDTVDRPGREALMAFLRERAAPGTVVIVSDIRDLADDSATYLEFRRDLLDMGAPLESPTIPIGDDPDSLLTEGVMISTWEFQDDFMRRLQEARARGDAQAEE